MQQAHASTVLSEIKIIEDDFTEAERLARKAYNLTRHDFIPESLSTVTWFELLKIGTANFSQDRLDAYLRKADELGYDELVFQIARNRRGDEQYQSSLYKRVFDADKEVIVDEVVAEEVGSFAQHGEAYKAAFEFFTLCDMLAVEGNRDCANSAKDVARHLSGELTEQGKIAAKALVRKLQAGSAASKVAKKPNTLPSSGKSVALIFHASDYESLLGDLKTPAEDAKRLASILKENYGFETRVVANPRRRDILKHLNDQQTLAKEDKLLIFFAGHGKSEGGTTFWLPVDASAEEESMWVEDTTIKRKLSLIPANNILVVADTCFSGNLTRGVEIVTEAPSEALFRKYNETKSRVAITSGGDQPVLDALGGKHSIFAEAFLSFLESQEQPFSASKVVQEIGPTVSKKSLAAGLAQMPRYGALYGQSGHDGPDFVFYPLKKKIKKLWNNLVPASSSYQAALIA